MKKIFISIIFLVAIYSCKEKYLPKVQSSGTGYLVVEGFINSGSGPSTITLTRSTKVYDQSNIVYERNALVNIEGENQEKFSLIEVSDGTYSSASLNLNTNEKYRIHITTQDGKEYVSDFEEVKFTPPIDSISWLRNNDGITIYANSHDQQNNTKYYRWDYEETWEFHSAFMSTLEYTFDPVTGQPNGIDYRNADHQPDTTIYKCWKTTFSTNINIASSEKLSSDVIYFPLLEIPQGDEKLSVLYSIKIKQYSLNQSAYLFYEAMKKNTEGLGTIFDPLPTTLPGNIHCITNPSEPVVGYVNISEEQDKRIFISNAEVPGWNYDSGCQLVLIDNNPDSIVKYGSNLTPTFPNEFRGLLIINFYASGPTCVDCTLSGTNAKPPFWP